MKLFSHLAVACVLVLAFGCSQDGASTPTSPELNSELGALQNTTAAVKNAVLVCHSNPEGTDGDPYWVVISVSSNGSSLSAHGLHGDVTGSCVNALEIGADCSSCIL